MSKRTRNSKEINESVISEPVKKSKRSKYTNKSKDKYNKNKKKKSDEVINESDNQDNSQSERVSENRGKNRNERVSNEQVVEQRLSNEEYLEEKTTNKIAKEVLTKEGEGEDSNVKDSEKTSFKSHLIKKIGFRVGVARIRGDAINEVQGKAESYLKKLLETLGKWGEETQKRHKITFEQIRTLAKLSPDLSPDHLPKQACPAFKEIKESGKDTKSKSGEVTNKKIKHYQKYKDCFIFSKTTLSKEMRNYTSQHGRVKFAKEATELLIYVLEKYIESILVLASDLSVHRGSKTVELKDINMVSKLNKL